MIPHMRCRWSVDTSDTPPANRAHAANAAAIHGRRTVLSDGHDRISPGTQPPPRTGFRVSKDTSDPPRAILSSALSTLPVPRPLGPRLLSQVYAVAVGAVPDVTVCRMLFTPWNDCGRTAYDRSRGVQAIGVGARGDPPGRPGTAGRPTTVRGQAGGVNGVAVDVARDNRRYHGGRHHRDHDLETAVGEFEDEGQAGQRSLHRGAEQRGRAHHRVRTRRRTR